jgi:hypothetical protein
VAPETTLSKERRSLSVVSTRAAETLKLFVGIVFAYIADELINKRKEKRGIKNFFMCK